MISQTAEYALRAVVDLAYHEGESRTTAQISDATKVPSGYLAKILQELSKSGLVRARRGIHGGFSLAMPANRMTVLDVLKVVDPPRRIRKCPLGIASHARNLCLLHQKLDEAMAEVEQGFRHATIADITASRDGETNPNGSGTPAISGGLGVQPERRIKPRPGPRSR